MSIFYLIVACGLAYWGSALCYQQISQQLRQKAAVEEYLRQKLGKDISIDEKLISKKQRSKRRNDSDETEDSDSDEESGKRKKKSKKSKKQKKTLMIQNQDDDLD